MDLLLWPFRGLGSFFAISVVGALGYIVGVIGFVTIPGALKLVRAVVPALPKPTAIAIAVVFGTIAGGIPLNLLLGGIGSFGGFGDVPTHDLAIARLNACPEAVAALATPIRRTKIGQGSYQTRGAFGTSTWELEVAGSKQSAKVTYSAEMHGGTWDLTSLAMKVGAAEHDLAACMHARGPLAGSAAVQVAREDLIGLWGTPHDRELVLSRFDADGTFTSGVFVDDKLQIRVYGTWELAGTHLVWHYDRAHSEAPPAYWDSIGSARMVADDNPIVEWSKARMVIQETGGQLTELRPMDPVRLADLVHQLAR